MTSYRHKWRILISVCVMICPVFNFCRPDQKLLIQASPLIVDLLLLKVGILLCIIVLQSIGDAPCSFEGSNKFFNLRRTNA